MKKKGFTIIELLAVMSIMALLLIFILPTLLKSRDNALEGLNKEQERNIKEAAKLLALDLDDYLSDVYNCKSTSWMGSGKCDMTGGKWTAATVTVEELVEHDYFKDDQKQCSGTVKISKTGSPYTVEYTDVTCKR